MDCALKDKADSECRRVLADFLLAPLLVLLLVVLVAPLDDLRRIRP